MKKQNILLCPLLLMVLVLVFAGSCKKDDNDIPILSTAAVTDITSSTAISGGTINSDGGATVTARGVCWSTGHTPTISDNKTTDGSGEGVFSSNLSGLSWGTNYYVRAYATNSKGTGYGGTMSFTTISIITDSRDGNVYQTVSIGNQVWMAENLKYLPSVVGSSTGSQTTPYYYVFDYNGTNVNTAKAQANYTTYGVLYNWPAAMNGAASSIANPSGVQGVCPIGWHLPSDAEWTELTDYLGGDNVAGGKLKETGMTHWNGPNTGASNETGFTGLPGGLRDYYGSFDNIENYGYWWSATDNGTTDAWYRRMQYNDNDVFRISHGKGLGYSVRCVKD